MLKKETSNEKKTHWYKKIADIMRKVEVAKPLWRKTTR